VNAVRIFGLSQSALNILRTPVTHLPPNFVRILRTLVDPTNRETLLACIKDESEREMLAQVEALAERPDLRFFHWEIEFPEVFFGFADANERQVKHKNVLKEGTAGFDCVVGNPPYDVLAEKELQIDLDEILAFFNEQPVFQPARGGKQNLYKLFICRGVSILRQGGRVGHIVPMPLRHHRAVVRFVASLHRKANSRI
jgi:hypothetical protein